MHAGQHNAPMVQGGCAHDVHDLGLVVLVQVGQDLGLAGSATGRLQKGFLKQVLALRFNQFVQIRIQNALLLDKRLYGRIRQKASAVIWVFDNFNQCRVGPPAGLVLPAGGVLAGAKADGSKRLF